MSTWRIHAICFERSVSHCCMKINQHRRTLAASENEVTGTSHVCLSTPRYVVVYQAQAVNATELNCITKTIVSINSYAVAMLRRTYPSNKHERVIVSKRPSQSSHTQVEATPYQYRRSNLPAHRKSRHPISSYRVDIVWCRPASQHLWRDLLDVAHRFDGPPGVAGSRSLSSR